MMAAPSDQRTLVLKDQPHQLGHYPLRHTDLTRRLPLPDRG